MTVAIGVLGAFVAPTAALADGDPEKPVLRWAVTPADESGKDDRASIQHALDAGASVIEHISVQNLGDREETFRLSAADGFTTSNGRFDMLASDKESTGSGTWIDIADEVTVPAGESVLVPFSITVPEQAEPGDHSAGVAASVATRQAVENGASLSVESRMGVKVTTRVKGELAPAVSVGDVSTTYDGSWNPFRPGQVTATVEVTNTGNTRLAIAGTASAGTGKTTFPAVAEQTGELLPGDTQQVMLAIDGSWPTFYVPGELIVAPEVAVLDGTSAAVDEVSISFGTWAIPWPQLLVLLALVLLFVALTGNRRRGRRHLELLLHQAREEGRRSATSPTSGQPTHGRNGRTIRARAALPMLALVAATSLTPALAAPAPDPGTDGVGLHVTITEFDDSTPAPIPGMPEDPGEAPGDGADGGHVSVPGAEGGNSESPGSGSLDDGGATNLDRDAPKGPDSRSQLAATGAESTTVLALGALAALLCGGAMIRHCCSPTQTNPA